MHPQNAKGVHSIKVRVICHKTTVILIELRWSFFDETLWLSIIDMVIVHADGRMTFQFQGGTEIDAYAPKT